MEKPIFNLPEPALSDPRALTPQPRNLKAWLNQLPLGDMEAAAGRILPVLSAYNLCRIPTAERFQSLNIFGRVSQELSAGLAAKYRNSAFPLSERNRERHSLVNRLLEEMALGFKWLVSDMLADLDESTRPRAEFFDAMRIAVVYLSRRIVSAYATYSLQPEGVWRDLHRIYTLAETCNPYPSTGQGKAGDIASADSVLQAYMRIVMLAVTNPYHLMSGEAQLIYNYLNKWSTGCRIVPVVQGGVNKGDLIIDLDGDSSPQLVFYTHVEHPERCRSIDMSQLMRRFRETIHNLTTRKASAAGEYAHLSFNERMRRDMLVRLQSVWQERSERVTQRTTVDDNIYLVSGLSACHHFIDEQRAFYPESDEVRIHRPERQQGLGPGLSLVPRDDEPWKAEQQQRDVDADIQRQRVSLYNDDVDIWVKIYASKSHARELHDQHAVRYKNHVWQQHNTSQSGMGLRHDAAQGAYISVGNIVAYHGEHGEQQWWLGVVAWMKEYGTDRFDLGVMHIPGIPQAVAARAISGTGDGSEYFRALLLSGERRGETVTQLIVPASIYDVGTRIVLNFRTELRYINLTGMARTTSCYSMFYFQDIDIPAVEQAKIRQIKSA